MRRTRLFALILMGFIAGCGHQPQAASNPTATLSVTFRDAAWDGREVPVIGRCRSCGGDGRSPALLVGGLPPTADEVIVEFNDLRITDLARNGGHGAIGVATGGAAEVVVPSVREETMSLPRGVRCVSKHRCVFYGHKPGAYKAPCGCGHGNVYEATVKAVRREGGKTVVLASTRVALGIF